MPKSVAVSDVEYVAPSKIARITCGIRYEPQYAVMDRVGTVIDAVLREEGTPFNPEVFPLSQTGPNEHVLFHPETDSLLKLTHQDTILQLPIDTRKVSAVRGTADAFQEYVLQPLRKSGLRHIIRYGIVLHLADSRAVLKSSPLTRYISTDFPGARSLSMRFTKRLATTEAIVKKRVDDYRNVIYTIEEGDDGSVHISLDYQQYFRPPLDASEWDDRPFTKFSAAGLQYFEGEFNAWFNKLVGTPEVA